MKVLAHLEGYLDFFCQRQRDMFGDLIFRCIQAREVGKIGSGWMFRRLDLDSGCGKRFDEHGLREGRG
jgi:hypothetical protein